MTQSENTILASICKIFSFKLDVIEEVYKQEASFDKTILILQIAQELAIDPLSIKNAKLSDEPVNVRWISLTEKLPQEGFEVLLFNKIWIHEDWNPKGIRVGYLDGMGGWISAYWCNYHDDYHTRTSDEDNEQFEDFKAENQVPTHWMEIPPCAG